MRITIPLVALFLSSCNPRISSIPDQINVTYPTIDFCDAKEYDTQILYVRGIYSGVEEYWSFSPIRSKCYKSVDAYLNVYENWASLSEEFKINFDSVHNNYARYKLILDAIGKFEIGSFGHLNTNNSRFTLLEVKSSKIINK